MFEQGPISLSGHGVIEYAESVLFLAAPFLFAIESGTAATLSVMLGLAVFLLAATTRGPTSVVDELPRPAHVVLDYLLAVVLVAAPFVFAFSGETKATAFYMALGLVHVLVTVGTRFELPSE